MELDPNNAIITGNLASFMAYIGHDHDEAERLYRKAIELDPNDASITGNLANFMTGIRKDNAGAERFYRKALELDPDDADINTNYSAFLLSQGNIGEARQRAFQAFKLGRDYGGQSVAEALLYLTIIEIIDKDSAKASLGRLKRVLKDGYRRGMWSFKHVFDFASTKLSLGDMTFCRALGDAVLDEDMVKDLDAFTVWTSIEAIPLDEPWPEIEKGTTEG
jgi:Tfp pilus assembly protein PilF